MGCPPSVDWPPDCTETQQKLCDNLLQGKQLIFYILVKSAVINGLGLIHHYLNQKYARKNQLNTSILIETNIFLWQILHLEFHWRNEIFMASKKLHLDPDSWFRLIRLPVWMCILTCWLVSHKTNMAAEPFYIIKQNTKLIAYIHIETSEKCKIVLALTASWN